MRVYRYDLYEKPQGVLNDDRNLATSIRREFLSLQRRVREAIFLAEEPAFSRSLKELDRALDNFVNDEVDPIMKLLDWARADLDK